MNNPRAETAATWPRRLGATMGAFAFVGGTLTLLGWYAGSTRLVSWDASGLTMKANTALCALMAGASLMMLTLPIKSRKIATIFGAVVAAIGALTAIEHITGLDFGIDLLLVHDQPGGLAIAEPGRMGMPGSTSFLLIGTSIILLAGDRRWQRVASILGMGTVGIASLSLVGYWYGASVMYSLPRVTGIALQTASMVFALGVGIVVSAPDTEPMRLLRSRSAAGRLARTLLPFIIGLPAILGWLRVSGQRLGLYDTAFGTALFALAIISLLAFLFWRILSSADRHELALSATQAELVVKEQQLRHVTDSAAVIVAQVDRDLYFRFVNLACADFLGLPVDQIVGRRYDVVMGIPALQAVQTYVDRVLQGERVEFETELPVTTVGTRYMRIAYTPDRDATGAVRGWISAVTDLTERKQTEIALRTAADALKQADQRKDVFLATLAHELRNPLAPIVNSLAILDASRADAQIVDAAITIMQRQLAQMVRMIDDLLDISRVTRDIIELRTDRVDLQAVITDAIDATRPLANSMGHEIVANMPAASTHLMADPARLTQVFGNLLHNACKFSEPGQPIHLDVRREQDSVIITVRDEGIGIAKEHIDSVFEMFMQVDRSLSRSRSGLGIGLTLVKRFVEMHHGTVTACSDGHGKGSAFTVRLPVKIAAEGAGRTIASASASPGHAQLILVVDDNRDAATTLAELLKMGGHEVHVAHDGDEAIEVAQRVRPRVILLDIGLPRKNGYDVCREVRATDWGKEILIVAISGWGQEEDRRKSREAGFDRHMVKPADFQTLVGMLAEHAALPAVAL